MIRVTLRVTCASFNETTKSCVIENSRCCVICSSFTKCLTGQCAPLCIDGKCTTMFKSISGLTLVLVRMGAKVRTEVRFDARSRLPVVKEEVVDE